MARCESGLGTHPATHDVSRAHAGVFQLSRNDYAELFEREYGWSWYDVVTDDATNVAAAYVVYGRWGDTFAAWSCRP